MNLRLWRVVERFCRGSVFDAAAFDAFAELVEEDQEGAVRKRVTGWDEEELEQLSFLISGTLDTVDHPTNRCSVLQCQGVYLTGSEASLLALGTREIPNDVRLGMLDAVREFVPDQIQIIIGSRIVPVTWVHGFSWKQWRAGLARDAAMFSRPRKAQPKQAPQSQAWILPVFVERGDFLASLDTNGSVAGVSRLGQGLAEALARFYRTACGSVPSDVTFHPILAAAHSCWANAKMIAVYDWARAIRTRAQEEGRTVLLEERPRRGSVRARDAQDGRILGTLKADASFPVDGTRLAIQLLTDDVPF